MWILRAAEERELYCIYMKRKVKKINVRKL
uniref:Uncharacterized protein n=1 Tax=Anguilla anguilla TaxID=7936 RepID=A0A0E9U6R3_ANGAN